MCSSPCFRLLAAGMLALVAQAAAAQAPMGALERAALLDRFGNMTPAERWQFIQQAKPKPAWHTVGRGDLVVQLVERGPLEATKATDISCRVKSEPMAMIRWVIEDGSAVKQGEKLLELDDSALRADLKRQQVRLDEASAAKVEAAQERTLTAREARLAVREADVAVAAADRARKAYKGNEPAEIAELELKLERWQVTAERARLEEAKRQTRAEAAVRNASALLEQEEARLRDIATQLTHCTLHAPHDGMAVYYLPEGRRGGPQQPIVAVGEPVREGQKLLRICDLSRMNVQTRVPEASISRVRKGAEAVIHVDAFPGQVHTGKVAAVATVASPPEFLARDIKVYAVTIQIDGANQRLKPGMSADVRLILDKRPNVLTVPKTAIIEQAKQKFCFVQDGKERVEMVAVTVGALNEQSIEVRTGLSEGDRVLTDPRIILSKLAEKLPR